MTSHDVAYYLGFANVKTFQSRLPKLRKLGFPDKIGALNRWDRAAIDRWLDEQSGLAEQSALEKAREALERWEP